MLKFLLDEQISPQVAEGLNRKTVEIVIHCVANWEDGRFLGLPDNLLLKEAARQNLTLVTYDRRTIPPILKTWAEQSRDHCGVVFVDPETIAPSDFGNLIRGLQKLWSECRDWNWTNRVVTLTR